MNEICENAEKFVDEMLNDFGYDFKVNAEWQEDEGCLISLEGEDVSYALSENGELLDAVETILFQVYGRELERHQRFVCDADGFRQTRKAELNAMAKFAAQNVRKNGKPFTFGVLNSTERRVIHLYLKEQEDLVSESIGTGRDRRLTVSLK